MAWATSYRYYCLSLSSSLFILYLSICYCLYVCDLRMLCVYVYQTQSYLRSLVVHMLKQGDGKKNPQL